jgi:2-keto-4-pentenoate hydratase/2-oxohepta-3-ene-1,7-dioic acid hydratase in catechol pathway
MTNLTETSWGHAADTAAPTWEWSLANVETSTGPVACLETPNGLYALEPSLARVGHPGHDTVLSLFGAWDELSLALPAAAYVVDEADRVISDRRLAPVLYPGKVVCAGANYFDHLEEMGVHGATKENQRLFFFMKPARNAVVGEGPTVRMPLDTQKFDWEIELAAVIGRTARAVSVEDALDHVAGYTVAMDLCARDLNLAPDTFYKLDWNAGKGHDTCCPLGPRIVPADSVGDVQDLGLRLAVNGQVKQDGRTTNMIFSLAEQISLLSRIMTLDPGDIVLTGTPAGVGVPRGEFLQVGDVVSAEIESVGAFEVIIQAPA